MFNVACNICFSEINKFGGNAYVTQDNKLAYCEIPKVGCTYWKKIIRLWSRDVEANVTSPERISRLYVHFGDWNHTKLMKLIKAKDIDMINRMDYKFTMTRDPYARLWSGYLDKLFLPDFWWWIGSNIVHQTRTNATFWSKHCGNDVTFTEFITFVVDHLKQGLPINTHFLPIHIQCNPCKVKFDAVGKVETFSSDVKLILNESGLGQLDAPAQKEDRSLEEIRMLTEYNFNIQDRLVKLGNKSECYYQPKIAYRIWRTFQFNGYIGDAFEFPANEVKSIGTRDKIRDFLMDKLVNIRSKASSNDIKQWSKQRKQYIAKAYRELPHDLKHALRDAFAKDFELFGYDANPDYIFS